jgi:MFS transporter, putative metabolite:H+ symporter
MNQVNRSRLFTASCFALITTAFAFAIRAGILNELNETLNLDDKQLGWINASAIFGFPVATIVGGILYNVIGAKKMVWLAFATHLLGIILTVTAGSFEMLLLSNFLIGFANGTVEAACNPLIAAMYKDDLTVQLNKFHVWFPGGLAIGSLIAQFMTGASWQSQIAVMFIPLVIYGYLFWGQEFPDAEGAGQAKVSDNLSGMLSPLYIFMLLCMTFTATSELGTQQWVERLLGKAGAQPLLILALVTGLMALGRFFGGGLIHRFKPTGVLWGSSVIATIGIVLMSQATGGLTYLAAVMFAIGVCFFWPTMIGFVGEYIPKAGAFGMSLIGGVGMMATGWFQPIIGGWITDGKIAEANALGHSVSTSEQLTELLKTLPTDIANSIELKAGQAALDNIAVFPAILIVLFGILFFWTRKQNATH